MSRLRSRSYGGPISLTESIVTRLYHIYYQSLVYETNSSYMQDVDVYLGEETIEDYLSARDRVVNKHRPWLNDLHPCSHQKIKVAGWDTERSVIHSVIEEGWTEYTKTYTYNNSYAYLHNWSTVALDENPLETPGINENSACSAYGDVDWVTLSDAFGEACKSLIPNAFFTGEDAVENDLFVQAFKTLLNPSNAIRETFRFAKWYKRVRGKGGFPLTLGNIANVVKGVANGNLLWQFAIKPAIHDIRATFDAHRAIDARIGYLSSHASSYVPIRVRRKNPSDISTDVRPTRPSQNPPTIWRECSEKKVVGSISAWGKVRSDIAVRPRWAAYIEYFGLNKIQGTIWELIPFSFVLDWFSNAQERINKLTRVQVSEPYTEIKNIAYARKSSELWDVFTSHPGWPNANTKPTSPTTLFSVEKSDYQRYIKCPGPGGFFTDPNLSVGKYASLGSLVIQRALKNVDGWELPVSSFLKP